MPFRTAPPDELVAAGRHVLRRQGCVLFDVPLCREQRKLLHQAALFRRNLAPRAVGAACTLAAGVDHRLPRVTAWAGPPDLFVAAKSHIIRRQGCVLFAVPLCEQLRFSLFRAKRSKCSSDRQPPPHEKSSVPAKPDGAVTSEYISKGATGCHSVFSIRRGVRPIWLCVAAFRRFCQNMRF